MASDEQIAEQAEQFSDVWDQAYRAILANRDLSEAQLPHVSIEQLNEVVGTIGKWLNRTRAPKGFAPTFQLAQSYIVTILPSVIQTMNSITNGEFTKLPTLVGHLNQMCSALHSMLVFGNKGETRDAIANLALELSETVSLIETAQSELATKRTLLESADEALQTVQTSHDQVVEIEKVASGNAKTISDSLTRANTELEGLLSLVDEAKTERETFAELVKKNSELQQEIAKQQESLRQLASHLREQQQLIDDLLPKGTSAALASAFARRVTQLEKPKWGWMIVFIMAISGLVAVGVCEAFTAAGSDPTTLLAMFLRRLPIIGPLIWLGWFSAMQYGNAIRVQEDYAFKEATSKAFAGYRDHMEHLSEISTSDGHNAMTMLSVRTIEILSREPLRVFGRADVDATPSRAIADLADRGIPKQSQPDQV